MMKINSDQDKHEFAIYFENLDFNLANELIVTDKDLYHRIVNILRLKLSERLILFNQNINILTQISEISKKFIKLQIIEKHDNKKLSPEITMLVSVLKRESFEEAIYYCVELGANVIQPVITQKVHFKNWQEKEWQRLQRIIISAAEQSKNFNFPTIQEPLKLDEIIKSLDTHSLKIFFDSNGQNFTEISYKFSKCKELILLTGPEGDLTPQEKETLHKAQFQFCKLTPTILRAQTAVSLALGLFRTI